MGLSTKTKNKIIEEYLNKTVIPLYALYPTKQYKNYKTNYGLMYNDGVIRGDYNTFEIASSAVFTINISNHYEFLKTTK